MSVYRTIGPLVYKGVLTQVNKIKPIYIKTPLCKKIESSLFMEARWPSGRASDSGAKVGPRSPCCIIEQDTLTLKNYW